MSHLITDRDWSYIICIFYILEYSKFTLDFGLVVSSFKIIPLIDFLTVASSFAIRRRKWQPTPVLLPGRSHGWRGMVVYSLWGGKELDTTEWFHFTSLLLFMGCSKVTFVEDFLMTLFIVALLMIKYFLVSGILVLDISCFYFYLLYILFRM